DAGQPAARVAVLTQPVDGARGAVLRRAREIALERQGGRAVREHVRAAVHGARRLHVRSGRVELERGSAAVLLTVDREITFPVRRADGTEKQLRGMRLPERVVDRERRGERIARGVIDIERYGREVLGVRREIEVRLDA